MKYSAKVTLAPLVVLVVGGSLTAYVTIHNENLRPARQPLGSSSFLNPTKTSPNQAFSGIDGMKITYPEHWVATSGVNNASNKAQQVVVFKAPNTTTKGHSYGDEVVVTGAKITLYKNSFSKSKNLDEFKQSDSFGWKYAENKKEYKIKDMSVAEFDLSYEAPSQHYAVFYKDLHEYVMVIDGAAYKNGQYKDAFENMMKNMEFKKSP